MPGPDHPITVARLQKHVVVSADGHKIADTRDALSLREANYPAVVYIPRKDVDLSLLKKTDHASYCPYKGDASYFNVPLAGARGENAVWSYETPHPAALAIKEHLAFYPDRVKIEETSL
ncbi:MAG TPA: DUF427 domain-containing protein [Methylovirgula sp.]